MDGISAHEYPFPRPSTAIPCLKCLVTIGVDGNSDDEARPAGKHHKSKKSKQRKHSESDSESGQPNSIPFSRHTSCCLCNPFESPIYLFSIVFVLDDGQHRKHKNKKDKHRKSHKRAKHIQESGLGLFAYDRVFISSR